MSTLTLTVNGQTVNRDVQPATLLVHFLRDTLSLTGTHGMLLTSECTVLNNRGPWKAHIKVHGNDITC